MAYVMDQRMLVGAPKLRTDSLAGRIHLGQTVKTRLERRQATFINYGTVPSAC